MRLDTNDSGAYVVVSKGLTDALTGHWVGMREGETDKNNSDSCKHKQNF